ncbi:hypothetical protein [Meinhardsimonia xiamenensis]|nr:hypothetical protein [Meinhardsimonia xiamenensis]
MSFIRPELRVQLMRWREALLGAAVACVAAYWAVTSLSTVGRAAGTSFAIVGLLILFAGIQRARFRRGSGGAGVVQLDEGVVVYFGPFEGGAVAVEALERVELDPAPPAGAWVLTTAENRAQPLVIPTDAANAEALFDVFAALEGLDTERMLRHLASHPGERVPVWEAPQRAGRAPRLTRS